MREPSMFQHAFIIPLPCHHSPSPQMQYGGGTFFLFRPPTPACHTLPFSPSPSPQCEWEGSFSQRVLLRYVTTNPDILPLTDYHLIADADALN
jgi:hypothetical protein